MLNAVQVAFLIAFGIVSIVHLIICFFEKEKIRAITKPICLALLGIFAVLTVPNHPFIYAGAFCSLAGDIFLIWKKNKAMFAFGTFAFIFAHVCYYIAINQSLSYVVPWWIHLIIGLVLLALVFILYPFTKKIAGKISMLGNFYMPLLSVQIAMGILLAIDNPYVWPGLLVIFGYVLFVISDSILTYTTFVKDMKRRDLYIMATYLAAEFLIITGLCMVVLFK